jgi:hypothetical protein
MKLKKGEKFIQIAKIDTYWLGLTNKGRFIQLDVLENRPGIGQKGAVFVDKESKLII